MREVIKRPSARRDIIEQADYFARTSLKTSDRFLKAVQDALRAIIVMPGMGSPRDFDNPFLKGLRVYAVPGFPKVGIYYLTTGDQIEVVRVLHGARDVAGILAAESDEDTNEDNNIEEDTGLL